MKIDPTERIARAKGNHMRAHDVDRMIHRMYKVHQFYIGSLGTI